MTGAKTWRIAALLLAAPLLAACANNHGHRNYFSSSEYGVAVSPRVTTAKYPPHGGGVYMANTAYVVHGQTYQPVAGPGYVATGEASWYGMDFHGRLTANGEIFGAYYLTAASPVLPIPCYARVTNLENGRSVMVRVNDRGPYMSGRVADLSLETATVLGYAAAGTARIKIAYVGPAPLEGDDSKMLMASFSTTTPAPVAPQIMVAEVQPSPQPTGPQNRNPLQGGLVGKLITSLLGYTDTDTNVNAAVAAATEMATRTPALDDWKASVDDDARKIQFQLGIFADAGRAQTVATDFALLGAVDEDTVEDGGQSATRLTLTHLKPGVSRADVVKLAQQLGLDGAVLY